MDINEMTREDIDRDVQRAIDRYYSLSEKLNESIGAPILVVSMSEVLVEVFISTLKDNVTDQEKMDLVESYLKEFEEKLFKRLFNDGEQASH